MLWWTPIWRNSENQGTKIKGYCGLKTMTSLQHCNIATNNQHFLGVLMSTFWWTFQITWSGFWNCWQPEDGLKTLREKTHVLRPWPTTCRWSLNTPRLLIFPNHIYCMCICKYTHIATIIRQSICSTKPIKLKSQTSPNHERPGVKLAGFPPNRSWPWVYEASVPAIFVESFAIFWKKKQLYQHSNT